jgi:hypothetical protein
MIIKLFLSALVVSTIAVNGQVLAQTTPTRPVTTTQEAEKIKNIRELLNVTGVKAISDQMMTQMLDSMKTQFPQVPAKVWDAFKAELNTDEMLNQLIPIYSKYYTNDEIKQMIAFYETPLGKKTIAVLPQITRESTAIGQQYGIAAAERALKKLEAEGYLRPNNNR